MSGAAGCPPRPSEAYIAAALEQECARVLDAPPHEANNSLVRAAFNLGTMEGAGWIDREFAERRLEQAAAQRCNDPTEAVATIRSGLDAGRQKPREWRTSTASAPRRQQVAKPATPFRDEKRERAKQMWEQASAAAGTLVEDYASGRSLTDVGSHESIRFCDDVKMGKHGRHPAMIGKISNPVTGTFYAIQRTALAPDGTDKAPINPAKQCLGPMEDGAVVLGDIDQAPIILEGEGIETVLSACQSTGLPGIATLGAERLGKPQLPPDAEVIILADLGSEEAARNGAERRTAEGRHVRLAVPPAGAGKDFNDTLRVFGPAGVKAAIEGAEHLERAKSYSARTLADVEPKSIEWLWLDRIALGRLSLLAGRPGLAKSQLTLQFAATVSRGDIWPDGSTCPRGSVILITCEDDVGDTVVPRLMACNADLKTIHCLDSITTQEDEQRVFDIQNGIEPLRELIRDIGDVRLIIIDPVSAYEGRADSHRNSEVRQLLQPLQELAAEGNAAVLLVTHLNKGTISGSADTRVTGSGAYVATCRSCWLVEEWKDGTGESVRAFAPIKNNIGKDREGFTYEIETCEVEGNITTSRVVFTSGPVPLHANDLIGSGSAAPKEQDKQIDTALKFLSDQLGEGAVPVSELRAAADAEDLAWRTVERAKKDLGIRSKKRPGRGGAWEWELPSPDQPELAFEGRQECQDRQETDDAYVGEEGRHPPEYQANGGLGDLGGLRSNNGGVIE